MAEDKGSKPSKERSQESINPPTSPPGRKIIKEHDDRREPHIGPIVTDTFAPPPQPPKKEK